VVSASCGVCVRAGCMRFAAGAVRAAD
jgi:hypothetical protein